MGTSKKEQMKRAERGREICGQCSTPKFMTCNSCGELICTSCDGMICWECSERAEKE